MIINIPNELGFACLAQVGSGKTIEEAVKELLEQSLKEENE